MGNRSRRPHQTPPTGPPSFDDTDGHSPYTIEGELAQLDHFVRGARRARGPFGLLAKGLVGWFLLSALSVPVILLVYVVYAVIDRHGL